MDLAKNTLNLTPKSGIPVLAYTTSDDPTPWLCTLSVKHCDAPMRTTLTLMFSISIRGFDDEQVFILIYDADNLVPGETTLGPANIRLPQDRLEKISRTGNPQLTTLSLTLKETCPVWGPSSGSIVPKSDLDSSYHQLVQLAGALQIHILFDYNQLHRNQHVRFKRLITHAKVLTGLPIEHTIAKRYQLVNLSLLISVKDAVSGVPPSYFDVSNKRSRQLATSISPEPPSSKRRAPSSSPYVDAPSPTEKGTPPPSPPAYAPASDKATRDAVATILPLLQSILPELIQPLLAVAPFSAPTPTNKDAKKSSYFSALLDARVAAHIEAQQSKINAGMFDHAEQINNAAGIELEEALEDHTLNMNIVKEDGIAALDKAIDDKLQEFEASTQEIVEGLEEHAQNVFITTREKLDELVGKQLAFLRRKWEKLEEERKKFEAEKQRHLGLKRSRSRSKRATSLPL